MKIAKNMQFLWLFFLPGCVLGPKYKTPCVKIPNKYLESKKNNPSAEIGKWWSFFNDSYLNELIEKAIENNYDLKIACEKIIETRALYQIQGSKLFPEIDLNAEINRTKYSNKLFLFNRLPKNPISYYRVGFDSIWELDFWGKLRRAKEAAYDEYLAQIETMHDVYIILLSDVAKTYIDICSLKYKIKLLKEQIKVNTQLLDLSKDRFKSGLVSEIQNLEQLAELDQFKSQLLNLETNLKQAIYQLAVLVGENPEDFNLEKDRKSIPISNKQLQIGLPSQLLRRRPDIRRAENLLAQATENVGVAMAEFFPSFTLLSSAGSETNKGTQLFSVGSSSWKIGPIMNWPIITFGRIRSNLKAKRSIARQALLNYEKTVIQAFKDVESSLKAYFNEKERNKLLAQKLSAVSKERDYVKSLYNSGLNSQTDYLNAEKNRINIEIEFTDSQNALSSDLISVYKSLGGDW